MSIVIFLFFTIILFFFAFELFSDRTQNPSQQEQFFF